MTINTGDRDYLADMYDEEKPLQNCVEIIYQSWEERRKGMTPTEKMKMTKAMKFYRRVGKVDITALAMALALTPDE